MYIHKTYITINFFVYRLKYPVVFIVYITVTLQVNGKCSYVYTNMVHKINNNFIVFFLLLPTILGSNDLLCSDSNLIVAMNDPSTFCQMQGLIMHNMYLATYKHIIIYRTAQILTGENIDEFDEFPAIRQYFPYQNFPFS